MVVVLCFSFGVALAAGAMVWRVRHELLGERVAVDALGEPVDAPADEPVGEEVTGLDQGRTVLLVGDDSGDTVSDELADIATGDRGGHRTDTIMLLRIEPDAKRVTGVNFPRDLFVTRCDGTQGRINGAWEIGGPDCLVETVRNFSGVTVDHYVEVDFDGFVGIVDAVGGVTMRLDEPMQDPKAHVDLPAGCVTLDGRSALGFVRTRADSDFGRIARQQRFMRELADEATSLTVLANPVRLYQMVDAVGELVSVDSGLGVGVMREFAVTLRGIDSDDISMATIPTTTDTSTGASYEHPIESETAELLTAFRTGTLPVYLGDDEPSEAPSPASEVPQVPRVPLDELAPVRVLNAAGVDQLAGRTAAVLEAAGIAVAETGDASPEPLQVMIRYPDGFEDEAEALRAAAFPDAIVDRDDTVDAVTVVLNGDVDPDELTIAGGDADTSTPDAAESEDTGPEYANAEPPEGHDDC